MLYKYLNTGSDKNNVIDIYLRKEKSQVVVTQFEINENQQLVICSGRLVIGRLGVLGIELSYELDQTIIETETDVLYFSPLFGDNVMQKVWRWAQGEKLTELPCTRSVPEFKWKLK